MNFQNEKAIQDWLRELLEQKGELRSTISVPDTFRSTNPDANAIWASFMRCLSFTLSNEILYDDANISKDKGKVLRPDFILNSPENSGYVIVEIKNAAKATREAGTELSAYASAMRNILPISSEDDYIKIIISQYWPTLLERYVCTEILTNRRDVLCLRPDRKGEGIVLSVVNPECFIRSLSNYSNKIIINGYHISLTDSNVYFRNKFDEHRMDKCVPGFLNLLDNLKSRAEHINASGFAFLWKDHHSHPTSQYAITLMNSITVPQTFISKPQFRNYNSDYPAINYTLSRLVDVITEGVEDFIMVEAECPNTWEVLRNVMLLQSHNDVISFKAWGNFGDSLDRSYRSGNIINNALNIGITAVSDVIDRSS